MAEFIAVSEPVGNVTWITLNRPDKKNALSVTLRDELSDALKFLAHDPRVKAVVLTGNGSVFCAGFDLAEFQQAVDDPLFHRQLWESSDVFHRAFLDFPLPIVAALNGPAIAGGFDLAVMCDLRIGCPETFFSHPEISFGEVVYGPLHDIVGGAKARELCLTGRKVPAKEALDIGLLNALVSKEDLAEETARFTTMITQAPREVCMSTKAKIIKRRAATASATLDL